MSKKIQPCVECLSTDIEIGDCGYSSFNVGWGKCRNCNNETKVQPCGCFPKDEIIHAWNKDNPDLKGAIKELNSEIERHKLHIESLKEQKKRYTRIHMEKKYGKEEKKNGS